MYRTGRCGRDARRLRASCDWPAGCSPRPGAGRPRSADSRDGLARVSSSANCACSCRSSATATPGRRASSARSAPPARASSAGSVVVSGRRPPPARRPARGPHPLPRGRAHVAQAGMNRRPRQPGRSGHHAHAAIPDLARLGRRPLPPPPLVQFRRQTRYFRRIRVTIGGSRTPQLCQNHSARLRTICMNYSCASPKGSRNKVSQVQWRGAMV